MTDETPERWFEYAIEERFPEAVNIDDLWDDYRKWLKTAEPFDGFNEWAKQLDRNKIERFEAA